MQIKFNFEICDKVRDLLQASFLNSYFSPNLKYHQLNGPRVHTVLSFLFPT
jgi:hypothetical protein